MPTDAESFAKQLLDQAEANAKRLLDNATEQAERMLRLNQPIWQRSTNASLDERARAIAGELQADPDLKAKVLGLLGVPAAPG